MQRIFSENHATIKMFRATLSESRFARYLIDSNNDAIKLYLWNTRLSQALYLPLQAWEISLRNKLNKFLSWKYSANWPYHAGAKRQFAHHESRKFQETIDRQARIKSLSRVPTDAIVADLGAGFWVGLLSRAYEVPFAWRYNLGKHIFSNEPTLQRHEAHEICSELLHLRNRVAHHEPIYHWSLADIRSDADRVLAAMCVATNGYARLACTFEDTWNDAP